jgi:glycosyltransferase involved in cell wall biosynthesis
MRIVLAVEEFYPRSKGGTELYVYNLAKGLLRNGHKVLVIAVDETKKKYMFENIEVYTIPNEKYPSRRQVQGLEAASNINIFKNIIDDFNPEIFHLHSITTSLNLFHVDLIKRKGVKVIFTAHQPGITCLTGKLMYKGNSVCDGLVVEDKCIPCFLETYKSTIVKKNIISLATKFHFLRNVYPAANFFNNKLNYIELLKKLVDEFIVVCDWQYKLFILNKFNGSNLSVVRQAVDNNWEITDKIKKIDGEIVFGFSGRFSIEKGIDFLLDVLSGMKSNNFKLLVAGITYSESDYSNYILNRISQMSNVELLIGADMKSFYDNIDLLCVPSEWLETGPFVVYEAFARKVPVIANKLGGMLELIDDGSNGILIDIGDKNKWIFHLNNIIDNPEIIMKMSENIKSARTSDDLVHETEKVYIK